MDGHHTNGYHAGKGQHYEETTGTLVGKDLPPNLALTVPPNVLLRGSYGKMRKGHTCGEKNLSCTPNGCSRSTYSLCCEADEAEDNRLATIPDREDAHEIILSELIYC